MPVMDYEALKQRLKECEVEYEVYENGTFQVQVRPNNSYFVQYDNFAGFFVDNKEDLANLHELLGALLEEDEDG